MYKFIALILALLGIDQISKALVVANSQVVGTHVNVIGDFFRIAYTRNSGAVFGLFQGLSDQYFVFIIFFVLAGVIFGIMFFKNDFSDKRTFLYALSLSLLIAGAFGNAIDRMFQPDHNVIDWIDFNGIWHYVFNFADVCLNVGIVLFLFDTFFLEQKRKKLANG